jgi:hypothetical protein
MVGISDSFDTIEQRMEKFLSWKDHLPHYFSRSVELDPRNNVCAITQDQETGYRTWNWASNIVTNDGDIYYAKKGAGETPATNENFIQGRCELRTGTVTPAKDDTYTDVTTPVTSSRDTLESGYPKTDDTGSSDNTGAATDAVSYKYYWATTDFNATGITGGCIHDNASPVSATKLLTHWTFSASFSKTSTDTLTLYVNHTMNGV